MSLRSFSCVSESLKKQQTARLRAFGRGGGGGLGAHSTLSIFEVGQGHVQVVFGTLAVFECSKLHEQIFLLCAIICVWTCVSMMRACVCMCVR